jgi:hypothetical protein
MTSNPHQADAARVAARIETGQLPSSVRTRVEDFIVPCGFTPAQAVVLVDQLNGGARSVEALCSTNVPHPLAGELVRQMNAGKCNLNLLMHNGLPPEFVMAFQKAIEGGTAHGN